MEYELIHKLSCKAKDMQKSIATEEATKTALVLPIISMLGYDITNPVEVVPEMDCDISGGNDKVDYAIFIDSKPILIIECKHLQKNLQYHYNQLAKYYVATPARFAALTNGREWRFYSDFDKPNLIDKTPFFVFNLNDYSKEDILLLEKFSKYNFNNFSLVRDFGRIYYTNKIRNCIRTLLSPSDEFVRYISNTAGVPDFQLCRETIINYFNIDDTKDPELSLDENEVVSAIKRTVSDIVDKDILRTIKYGSYLSVCKYGNRYRWVARIKIRKNKKLIGFPRKEYTGCDWYEFETTDDILGMKDIIVRALDVASFKTTRQQQKAEKTANTPQLKITTHITS